MEMDLKQSPKPTIIGTAPLLKKLMGKKKKSSNELLCGCLAGPCTGEVCPGSAPWLTTN